jgi:3-phenylpropionate/trans-cinnamate dioxygenase ferredoxin subunit
MPLTIKVRKDGPYFIDLTQGTVTITDHEGNPIPIPEGKTGIALCRCGASIRKPFCDGTHTRIGFEAAEAAQKAADTTAAPPAAS